MAKEVEQQWFVARTRAKQEKAIQERIESLGIQTYLPIRTEIRKWSDRKRKVDTVLVPNTIFIHASKKEATGLHNEQGLAINYLRDVTCEKPGAMLVVPDYQMESFMKFLEITQGQYDVEDALIYRKGDHVIVTSGPLKGLIGELVRVDGKNKVVVRLGDLIACSVTLTTDEIEKVNDLV